VEKNMLYYLVSQAKKSDHSGEVFCMSFLFELYKNATLFKKKVVKAVKEKVERRFQRAHFQTNKLNGSLRFVLSFQKW